MLTQSVLVKQEDMRETFVECQLCTVPD